MYCVAQQYLNTTTTICFFMKTKFVVKIFADIFAQLVLFFVGITAMNKFMIANPSWINLVMDCAIDMEALP